MHLHLTKMQNILAPQREAIEDRGFWLPARLFAV